MPKYPITWVDYRLPTGRQFSVAVCGSSGRICHMFLGDDVLRRSIICQVNVEGQNCSGGQYCLALDCPLNKTSREHLVYMLDMHEDEVLDEETAKLWGTDSATEGLVKFAEKMNPSIPEELQKGTQTEQ